MNFLLKVFIEVFIVLIVCIVFCVFIFIWLDTFYKKKFGQKKKFQPRGQRYFVCFLSHLEKKMSVVQWLE